jgi:Universal stress protein family
VVMGAVSRSGLKGLFIGNTAERILDELSCDILLVKPLKSRNRVSASGDKNCGAFESTRTKVG